MIDAKALRILEDNWKDVALKLSDEIDGLIPRMCISKSVVSYSDRGEHIRIILLFYYQYIARVLNRTTDMTTSWETRILIAMEPSFIQVSNPKYIYALKSIIQARTEVIRKTPWLSFVKGDVGRDKVSMLCGKHNVYQQTIDMQDFVLRVTSKG